MEELLAAYYECLNGNIGVPVYQMAVPSSERGDHVLIRAESSNDSSNRHHFDDNAVVILEAITWHDAGIDASKVEQISKDIRSAVFLTRRTYGVEDTNDLQFLLITLSDSFYDDEFDGQRYKHRKIMRFTNRINYLTQTSS